MTGSLLVAIVVAACFFFVAHELYLLKMEVHKMLYGEDDEAWKTMHGREKKWRRVKTVK